MILFTRNSLGPLKLCIYQAVWFSLVQFVIRMVIFMFPRWSWKHCSPLHGQRELEQPEASEASHCLQVMVGFSKLSLDFFFSIGFLSCCLKPFLKQYMSHCFNKQLQTKKKDHQAGKHEWACGWESDRKQLLRIKERLVCCFSSAGKVKG